jgi:hypothetical protein
MKLKKLTFLRGNDYACIMRPSETTERPLAALCGDDATIDRYGKLFAAAPALLAALKLFAERIEQSGEWDDGCFYYGGRSAPELQEPLSLALDAVTRAERGEK